MVEEQEAVIAEVVSTIEVNEYIAEEVVDEKMVA